MKDKDLKIKDAVEFYFEMRELKQLIRQGAVQWKVNRPRFESDAEHIALTETLAIALADQLNLREEFDMGYLLNMINFHEIGELKIGDLTIYNNPDTKDKHAKELAHAKQLLKNLKSCDYFVNMINDFNNGFTLEARFAKACDKLENVLEFKRYCDEHAVSIENASPEMLNFPKVKVLLDRGINSLDDIWYFYHLPSFEYLGFDKDTWYNCIKPMDSGL